MRAVESFSLAHLVSLHGSPFRATRSSLALLMVGALGCSGELDGAAQTSLDEPPLAAEPGVEERATATDPALPAEGEGDSAGAGPASAPAQGSVPESSTLTGPMLGSDIPGAASSDPAPPASEPAASLESEPSGESCGAGQACAPAGTCEAGLQAACGEGALACENTQGGHVCSCGDGYTGSGSQGCQACPTWFADCDGDGYAPAEAASVRSCETPAPLPGCVGWTQRAPEQGATDCEDLSPAHHPGADFGLMVDGSGTGLAALFCRPDGSYAQSSTRRCVVTSNPDLNCDGVLEPVSAGATFCISGGHCIAALTHACSDESDCSCWTGEPPCGVVRGVAPNLCPGGSPFTGDTALLCR